MEASETQKLDVLALIDQLDELLSNAKAVPLSDQLRVEKEEVYALLDGIRATLPDAVKQARWVVKQREQLMTEAQRECERLLGEAGEQAARLTSEAAVERLADRRADEIPAAARLTAHEQLLKVDEWAEQILATLDPNFERFLRAIQRGRQGLPDLSSHESVADIEAG
jgi:cell division septum initiation protein DivIVA